MSASRARRPAKDYVRKKGAPIVVKADGLAAGKGVVVAETVAEAEAAIDMMFGGGLGQPAWEIVIEDCLVGEEASFFALCDGETAIALASAQDHKRVGDGDKGPNTGGMGAYSPAPVMTADMNRRVMDEIIQPTVRAMKAMGAPYKGVLFAGLMITKDGPQLIEYNVRFGDPECQVLMLRLKSDLLPALIAARDGQLKHFDLRWYDDAALTVVMAAKGYPGNYDKGSRDRRTRRGGAGRGRGNLSCRHHSRRRSHCRERRPRAECLRARQDGGAKRNSAPTLPIDQIKLAGWILPARHRLARNRARKKPIKFDDKQHVR